MTKATVFTLKLEAELRDAFVGVRVVQADGFHVRGALGEDGTDAPAASRRRRSDSAASTPRA